MLEQSTKTRNLQPAGFDLLLGPVRSGPVQGPCLVHVQLQQSHT